MEITQELAGRFRLETSGGERGYIDHGWNENLILNAGIDRLLSTVIGTTLSFISVGSSSVSVSPTQTQLLNKIATTNRSTKESYGYSDEGFGFSRLSVQFDQGAAAGNISELGIGWDVSGVLFSRALVVDGAGLPTAITVLPDEFLTVTYELRRWWIYPPAVELSYFDQGIEKTTLVSPIETASTTPTGLGAAPINGWLGFDGATVTRGARSDGVLNFKINYALEQGNPRISTVIAGASTPATNLFPAGSGFRFTPPIDKTAEFTVSLDCQVTFKRRGE